MAVPSTEPFQSTMAMDMDVDMDIDLDVDPETAQLEAEAMRLENEAPGAQQDTPFSEQTPQALAGAELAFEKVHIRGLDNLTTGDLKTYVAEHLANDQFVRIEWIDDTSANFLYSSSEAASNALNVLTNPATANGSSPLDLRRAKPLSAHPESELWVRQATTSDVKKAHAHEASRFYLLNPEQDPRERKRGNRGQGRRYSDDRGDYRRRQFDDREHRRRTDGQGFDVSMYDDEPSEARPRRTNKRKGSYSSQGSYGENESGKRYRAGRGKDTDLFPNNLAGRRGDGRLRDRSASPMRDDDFGRRKARQRSLTPPSRRTKQGTNAGKELFPSSQQKTSQKELFPEKVSTNKPKELFPNKTAISNHRRTAALDETASFSPNGKRTAVAEGWNGGKSRDLLSRLSRSSSVGRLHDRPKNLPVDDRQGQGFSFRGAAEAQEDSGFSIRGASRASEETAEKELFPTKTGRNAGKELFGDKTKERGGWR